MYSVYNVYSLYSVYSVYNVYILYSVYSAVCIISTLSSRQGRVYSALCEVTCMQFVHCEQLAMSSLYCVLFCKVWYFVDLFLGRFHTTSYQ